MDYLLDKTRLGELIGEQSSMSSTAAVVIAGFLGMALFLFVFIAWLKGRKLGGLLIWLVLALVVLWFAAPLTWLDGVVDVPEETISLALGVAVGASLLWGVFAAARLAKPSSWWAQRRYASEKYDKAVERYGWSRIKAR